MEKEIFKPKKVKDPLTGKERVLSPEEQEELLEKGVFIDPAEDKKKSKGKNEQS